MSSAEALIAAGRAVIALDANAITGFRRLQRVCNQVNILRAPPVPDDIRLCVPAVVHIEVIFDLCVSRAPAGNAARPLISPSRPRRRMKGGSW